MSQPASETIAVARPASANQTIEIPAGTLHIGSRTGTPDRDPSREADFVAAEIPAFAIDALPFPNDPSQASRVSVSRAEAEKLCEGTGKHLCSELQWERACKGEPEQEYPTSGPFDAATCLQKPLSCATPFGVFAMGTLGREWTSSPRTKGLGDALRNAVVRGAGSKAAPTLHRCAARDVATADSRSDSLGFRCCRGEPLALPYPTERERPNFEERALELASVRAALAKMPETRDVAESFRPFSESDLNASLTKAGHSQKGMAPWLAVHGTLRWSPVHGEDIIVVAGDLTRGASVIAYHPLPDGEAQLAALYETKNEHDAILLAYKPDAPLELLVSTCWGCGGEGAAITFGTDARVRITPR